MEDYGQPSRIVLATFSKQHSDDMGDSHIATLLNRGAGVAHWPDERIGRGRRGIEHAPSGCRALKRLSHTGLLVALLARARSAEAATRRVGISPPLATDIRLELLAAANS